MDVSFLYPYFVGAHAENHELFEQLLLEFIHDHMYWRRNFHPDDPPPIPASSSQTAEYQAFVAKMKQELLALAALLKSSIPLFSPRYMGHMLCDPLIPGLLAQMITLPYNPNNVSEEAAPATVSLEIKVGLQLAQMLGYEAEPTRTPCAFGYLTSGGTVANYQALQVLRSAKYFPLALRAGLRHVGLRSPAEGLLGELLEQDRARLANTSLADSIAYFEAWLEFLGKEEDPVRRKALARAVHEARLETLGAHAFFSMHRGECSPPVILAPDTIHYSWTKAVRLTAIGESGLMRVPTRGMRLDPQALERALTAAHKIGQSVLCVVGVLGSTEYGTLDSVDQLISARERWQAQGLGFAVHVDAAWGGYLATLFRDETGGFLPREEVARHFRHFPSERVHAAFRALGQADSITVDPHKLGYLPYGTGGAYVCRDHRLMDFVAQGAAYLGSALPETKAESAYQTKFRRLGRYILEGSKPGAAAAAAYVTHRTLPLDADHFGRLLQHSIQEAEYFYEKVLVLRERLASFVRIAIPIEPDSNLVCVAFNPTCNRSAAAMNRFVDAVFDDLRVNPMVPLQSRKFFSSSTVLYRRMLSAAEARRISDELGLDAATFVAEPEDEERDADGLRVLRHTLMNPWLHDDVNGIDYVDKYCQHLEESLRLHLERRSNPAGFDTGIQLRV